jgi:hypothetical protein
MSYRVTHHFSFSQLEARDALVESVRSRKDGTAPTLPEDSNAVQLIMLGPDQLILVWETRADPKPAWLPKNNTPN